MLSIVLVVQCHSALINSTGRDCLCVASKRFYSFRATCSQWLFRGKEKRNTRQDPVLGVGVLTFHGNAEEGHEVGNIVDTLTTLGNEVHGAIVEPIKHSPTLSDGGHMHNWESGR